MTVAIPHPRLPSRVARFLTFGKDIVWPWPP